MPTDNISLEEIQNIQGSLCDMISAYDLDNKLKGNTGFILKTVVCDAGGNALFSYDTVMKYYEDENGIGKVSAETAGKIVENIVFDAGLKKTVQLTLAASTSALFDSEPLTAGIVAVGTFTTGYAFTKTASVTAGELTKKLIEQYINELNSKVIARENDETILEQDPETNTTIISNDETTQINLLPFIKTDKVQVDDIVYIKQDLTNQTSLQIRNLLTDINSVNILLSNVLIKIDEKLDLGEKGIYTVKSGDTFSQIANNNGFTTKELLEKNTWLIDDNRITFNTPSEILVNQTANLNNNNQDHTLIGTNSDDILIDHNGGDDLFEAGQGTNYIDGGTGFDTISYKSSTEAVTVDLSLSAAQAVNSTTTDTLVSIENVIGSDFNDKITGNSQDNDLVGGKGNDTYVFNKTSENDTIIDSEGIDEIIFGVGIFLEKLEFFRTGTDLLIKFKNDDMKNSSLTINSFFLDKNNEIEKIKFQSDYANNILNLSEYLDLNNYTIIGTDLSDNISANRDINVVYGLEGKDYIYGNNESKLNILYGGSPEDAYNTGEYTSSTSSSKFDLYYKTAEDYITGGSSANTNLDFENYLYGGEGNDLLSSGENVSNYLYGGAGDDFLRTSLSISFTCMCYF